MCKSFWRTHETCALPPNKSRISQSIPCCQITNKNKISSSVSSLRGDPFFRSLDIGQFQSISLCVCCPQIDFGQHTARGRSQITKSNGQAKAEHHNPFSSSLSNSCPPPLLKVNIQSADDDHDLIKRGRIFHTPASPMYVKTVAERLKIQWVEINSGKKTPIELSDLLQKIYGSIFFRKIHWQIFLIVGHGLSYFWLFLFLGFLQLMALLIFLQLSLAFARQRRLRVTQ